MFDYNIYIIFRKLPYLTENVVGITDLKSVLDAISCYGEYIPRIKHYKLHDRRRVVQQWIPAHGAISGNGKTAKLVKRGANIQQENLTISIKQKKTIIKSMF